MGCRTLLLLLTVGCASGAETLGEHSCPTGTTLTYETFGRQFLDDWCQGCHASDVMRRDGAPENVTFDTPTDVARWKERIFINAAAANTYMPPGPDDPPPEARDQLADWLACGAP